MGRRREGQGGVGRGRERAGREGKERADQLQTQARLEGNTRPT